MGPGEWFRFVGPLGLVFVAWFAVVGWTQFRRGGEGFRFLAVMAGLSGGCLALCLVTSWMWSLLGR